MYEISDISTFYCPKAKEYLAAEKEVSEFADKLAKEKGTQIIRCGLWKYTAGDGI